MLQIIHGRPGDLGDSWLVLAGTDHSYRIIAAFSAVEATAPPAQVHGRDE